MCVGKMNYDFNASVFFLRKKLQLQFKMKRVFGSFKNINRFMGNRKS